MLCRDHDVIVKDVPSEEIRPFDSLDELLDCLRLGQGLRYSGEPISHWEHALQTAALAMQAEAAPSLVAAALLHDVGHLVAPPPPGTPLKPGHTPTLQGLDDRHEHAAPQVLARLFAEDVIGPIRLHVQAKRYLVSMSDSYVRKLSADSRRSLQLQGGAMSPAECELFRAQSFAGDALRLRCWDDLAKSPDAPSQRLERFLPALRATLLAPR